ncbi:hypothetical protein HK096_003149 [Nowakowskiella sp. JEL0078]|nr:hypothetical protein HK096_003149 [Nowakowskiella sp. JEL0078]
MTSEPEVSVEVMIVGAGLAGIALALALVQSKVNIHVTLLERDDFKTSRNQGLVFFLRQESIDILTKRLCCELIEQRLLHMKGPKDIVIFHENQVIFNGVGWATANCKGVKTSTMVDRSALRNYLMECLPENSERIEIKYGKKFDRYQETETLVSAYFCDGSVETGDFLIGADGDRSKVRLQRCPELEPVNLGFWSALGSVSLAKFSDMELKSFIYEITKRALIRTAGKQGSNFMCFRYNSHTNEERLIWSLSMPNLDTQTEKITSCQDNNTLLKKLVELANNCYDTSDEISSIISRTESDSLYTYNVHSVSAQTVKSNPLQMQKSSRITLIGDAAHKTTANAGMGATAAFTDAISLADRIISGLSKKSNITEELRKYESEMSANAAKVVEDSVSNTLRFHETDPVKAASSLRFLKIFGYFLGIVNYVYGFFS